MIFRTAILPLTVVAAAAAVADAGGAKQLTPDNLGEAEAVLSADDRLPAAVKKAAARLGPAHDVFEGVFARWYARDGKQCKALEILGHETGITTRVADVSAVLCTWKKPTPLKASSFGKPFKPRIALAGPAFYDEETGMMPVKVFEFAATCEQANALTGGDEIPKGQRYLELTVPWKAGAKVSTANQDRFTAHFMNVPAAPNTDDKWQLHAAEKAQIEVVSVTREFGALARIKLKMSHAAFKAGFEHETDDSAEGELDVRVCE